jgi:endonuclease-8
MPEGDALHRAADRLQVLVGERVEASSPNPRGLATGVACAVDGRVLESVEAVGKHLLLRFEGGVTVRSHLRMNGRWRVRARSDRRRTGSPWLVLATPRVEATQWNALNRGSRCAPDASMIGRRSAAATPVIPTPRRIRGALVASSIRVPCVARSTSSSARSS